MSGVDPIDMSLDDYIAQNKTKSRDGSQKKRNWDKNTGKKSRMKGGKRSKAIVDARQNLSRQNERSISNQNITTQSLRKTGIFDARQMIPQSRQETKQKLSRRQDRDTTNDLRRARRESIDKDRKRRRSDAVEEKRNMSSTRNRNDGSLLITLRNETRSKPTEKNATKFTSSDSFTTRVNIKNDIVQSKVPSKAVLHSSKVTPSNVSKVSKASLITPGSLKVTIFNELSEQQQEKKTVEHVVVVSNLYYTVSEGDIKELFGAYGRLQSVKFDANNGIAEVIYANKNDAIEAVSSYHNRNLDGYPMHCKLVTDHGYTQRNN